MAAGIKRDQDQEKKHKAQATSEKYQAGERRLRYATARLGFPGRS